MLSDNIMGMRMVHFEKISSKERCTNKMEENEGGRINKYFCSCGYYDRMTYVRAKDNSSIMDYKHCFLIKYPYKHMNQQLIADQMFTLLLDDMGDGQEDPFEFTKVDKAPFLGIIMVTIGTKLEEPELKYSPLLREYRDVCLEVLRQEMKESIGSYKVFYTPNCADLCIVIRTNMLKDIYNVKKELSVREFDSCPSGECYTTSYTLFQVSDVQWSNEIIEANKALKIELRLSSTEEVMQKISEDVNCNVYGITGNGQYSVELDFATFSSVYPFLCKIKMRMDIPLQSDTELQKIFFNNIDCSYMRVKYEPKFILEYECKQETNDTPNLKEMKEFEKRIKDCICKKVLDDISLGNYLREQKTMLRELLYTYNNLWLRQSSWWKGLLFYSQLESILLGIEQYETLIKEIDLQTNRAILAKQTCKDLAQAISNVNNYNKLLQSVNQYVVNVPNYEMQTKVNVEKYLMAYTMYLFEISNNYFRVHTEGVDRIYPLFTLDFTAPGMQAHTLFGAITVMGSKPSKSSENKWTTLFTVECPNHQWFANIYHVLPMITHEMSHNFRYLEREKRNKFVFDFLSGKMAKYMADILLSIVTDSVTSDYDCSRKKFFIEHIRNALQKEMTTYNEAEGKNIRLRDIGVYSRKKFLQIMGYYEEASVKLQLWDTIGEEMLQIYKICRIKYVAPKDICKNEITMIDMYEIQFNVLLDILMDKRNSIEVCEEWRAEVLKIKTNQKEIQLQINVVLQILEHYREKRNIIVSTLCLVLDNAIHYWKNSDGTLDKLSTEDTNIKSCIEAVCAQNINKAFHFLSLVEKSESGKSENKKFEPVSVLTLYCEKLHHFCYCYANIVTSIQWNSVDVIMPREVKAKDFAQKLHESMNGTYGQMINEINKEANSWITYKEEQRILTSMGIVNSSCNQFFDNYKDMLQRISSKKLQAIIDDSLRLYQEVFADYGMCRAFSFSSYGYFMYCIHIFMKQREVPENLARNFTSDRIRTLLLTIYKHELDEFKRNLSSYWTDLREQLKLKYGKDCLKELRKLCEYANFFQLEKAGISDAINVMISRDNFVKQNELVKYLEILRWMVILYEELQLEDEIEYKDPLVQELYQHICLVDERVVGKEDTNELWIKRCQKNEQLKQIGEYYNNFSYTNVLQQNSEGKCLENQNRFVFNYYGKMFDCFHYVKKQMQNNSSQRNDIINYLFEYEIKEEGE